MQPSLLSTTLKYHAYLTTEIGTFLSKQYTLFSDISLQYQTTDLTNTQHIENVSTYYGSNKYIIPENKTSRYRTFLAKLPSHSGGQKFPLLPAEPNSFSCLPKTSIGHWTICILSKYFQYCSAFPPTSFYASGFNTCDSVCSCNCNVYCSSSIPLS